MPITSLGGNSGGGTGGGGGLPTLTGNGIVVHHKGQWTVVELDAVYPMLVNNPNGLRGNPLFEVATSLGEGREISLATTGYKGIRMRAFMYCLRRISLGISTLGGVPTGCKISIWSDRDGAGDKLGEFDAAALASMETWQVAKVIELPPAYRLAEWLYVNVEVASSVPAFINVWAYGDIAIQNDLRGQPA